MSADGREYCFPGYVELGGARYRERFGLDFEDFAVGQVFRHRPGYTFTQQDNITESLDTLNQAMLHYDARYAAATEFGRPLMVTTAIMQRLVGMGWKTFNRRKRIVRKNFSRMLAPVFAGDTLYAESTITDLQERCDDPQCGQLSAAMAAINQDGTKTCEMEFVMLIYRAAHLPFAANNY